MRSRLETAVSRLALLVAGCADLAGEILDGGPKAGLEIWRRSTSSRCISSAPARMPVANLREIGKLLLAAAGKAFEPVVLHLELGEQFLAATIEPVGEALDAVGEQGRAVDAVASEDDRGFGQDIVELGLELGSGIGDQVFLGFAAAVGIEGEQDHDDDDDGVDRWQLSRK